MDARTRRNRVLLPFGFTLVLCVATLRFLIGDLPSAVADYRAAQARLEQQRVSYERVVADRNDKAVELVALRRDPQEVLRALEEIGIRPPKVTPPNER